MNQSILLLSTKWQHLKALQEKIKPVVARELSTKHNDISFTSVLCKKCLTTRRQSLAAFRKHCANNRHFSTFNFNLRKTLTFWRWERPILSKARTRTLWSSVRIPLVAQMKVVLCTYRPRNGPICSPKRKRERGVHKVVPVLNKLRTMYAMKLYRCTSWR